MCIDIKLNAVAENITVNDGMKTKKKKMKWNQLSSQ